MTSCGRDDRAAEGAFMAGVTKAAALVFSPLSTPAWPYKREPDPAAPAAAKLLHVES